MSDLREAARQALEALQKIYLAPEHDEYIRVWWPACEKAITTLRAALAQQDEPAQQTRKDGHYSVAYRCECGHKQNVTEIVRGGRTYAGSGANWCDGCGDGPPVRVDAIQQQAEPVDFVSLLREADEIVRGKPTWKRFIDGTPLSNDIAVWMTVFAQDVARRAAPSQRQPLTDEEIYDMYNEPRSDAEMVAFARAVEAAHGIKERV